MGVLDFPTRDTRMGVSILGEILIEFSFGRYNLEPETVHMLSSANRWEWHDLILERVNHGWIVIASEYIFTGAAFSTARVIDSVKYDCLSLIFYFLRMIWVEIQLNGFVGTMVSLFPI